jgi:hypothetical protein
MCDIADKINKRAGENLMRIQLEQAEKDKIKALGKECRALAADGRLFNEGECDLFYRSLHAKDFDQCDRLIKTLEQRATK